MCGIGKSGFISSGRTFLASLHTSFMNSSNLSHTTQNGRVVRHGYDRLLQDQARATRKCVGGDPSDVLQTHCPSSFSKDAQYSLMSWKLGRTVSVCDSGITLYFLRPEHDFRSHFVPEEDASVMCLDAVLGKVHLSCWRFIVVRSGPGVVHNLSFCVFGMVMCTGTSTAFCSSDESPPTYSHSSKRALLKVSPIGVQYTHSRALSDSSFFWGSNKVLVWHLCHHVIESLSTTHSRVWLFFLVISLSRW